MDKCIRCTEPKKGCNILGFFNLPLPELAAMCKKRKQFLGWTAQIVADKAHLPIGTANRFFGGDLTDFRFETVRSIVCALWDIPTGECEGMRDKAAADDVTVAVLREIIAKQGESIARLREQIDRKDDYIDRLAKKAGI